MTSPSNIHCNRRPGKQVISGLVCALAYWSILVVGHSNGHSLGTAPGREVCSPFSTEPASGDKSGSVQISQRPFHQNATQGLPTFRTKGSVSRLPRGSTCTGSAHVHAGLNSGFTPNVTPSRHCFFEGIGLSARFGERELIFEAAR
jgi:hypothetical protein